MVDQEQRDEACKELQAAIDSTKLKMGIKEKELEGTAEEESEGLKGEISNLKDIIGDMEERVCFLPSVFAPLRAFFPHVTDHLSTRFCFVSSSNEPSQITNYPPPAHRPSRAPYRP